MIEFKLPDMSCGHCVAAVTQAVRQLDGDAKVEVDLANKRARVESARGREEIARALADAGYPPAAP